MTRVNPAEHLRGLLTDLGVNPRDIKLSGSGGNEEYAQLTQHNMRKHNDIIVAHAEHLADRGINLSIAEYGCGHKRVGRFGQNSYGAEGGELSIYRYDMPCETCR